MHRALRQHAAGCIDKKIEHTVSLKAFRTAFLILLKLLRGPANSGAIGFNVCQLCL